MSYLYSSTDHLDVDDSNISYTNPGFCDYDNDSDSDFTSIDLVLDEGTGSDKGDKSVVATSDVSPKYITTTVQIRRPQVGRATESRTIPQPDSQSKTTKPEIITEFDDSSAEVVLCPMARKNGGSENSQNQSHTFIEHSGSLGDRKKETLIELDNLVESSIPCDTGGAGGAYVCFKPGSKHEKTGTKSASTSRKSKDIDTNIHAEGGYGIPSSSLSCISAASKSHQGFSTNFTKFQNPPNPLSDQFVKKSDRSSTISSGYQTVAWSSRPRPRLTKTYSLRIPNRSSPPQSPKPLCKLLFSDFDDKTCRKYDPLKSSDLLPQAPSLPGHNECCGKENLFPFPPRVDSIMLGLMRELMAHGKLRRMALLCRLRKTPIAILPASWEISESLATTFIKAVSDDSQDFVRISLDEQVYVFMQHGHHCIIGHGHDSTIVVKSTTYESFVAVGLSTDKTEGSCLQEVNLLVSDLNKKGW